MTQAAYNSYQPYTAGMAERDALTRLDRFATFMDSAIRVPGTGITFGADAALGLIPGVGNLLSTLLSGWFLREAWQLGASNTLILRMLGNIAFDSLVSAVPVAGNVLDVFWRANRR